MRAWAPVLSGGDADAARAAVAEIAEELIRADTVETRHPSLAVGRAGIGLFLHYAARSGIWPAGTAAGSTALREAVLAANAAGINPELYGGLTGVAWTVAHSQPAAAVQVVAHSVDAGLAGMLQETPELIPFDLIGGLVGYGVYALERLPDPGAHLLAEKVVERLAECALRREGVLAWASDTPGHEDAAGQRLNLGVAHGTPGVVAFLASCHTAGISRARVEELLEPAVTWILSQRLPNSEAGVFPYWLDFGHPTGPARLAWCYGDTAVALALLRAARAVGAAPWELEALEIAERAARRPAELAGVVDCGLCHGALGLAQIFGRLHAESGHGAFAAAARRWIAWAFDRRSPGRGYAGFLTRDDDGTGQARERPVPGFLVGAAGIGLALVAAASQVDPAWDRVMLLSGPNSSGSVQDSRTPP